MSPHSPNTAPDYGRLYDLITAPIASRLLLTGLELGVFDHLETQRTAEATAELLGTHSENTAMFLDALVCIDLLTKSNGLYRNTSEASNFLRTNGPIPMNALLRQVTAMCVDPLRDLSELVRNGPKATADDPHFASEELWAMSARAGAAWVYGGVGSLMAGYLAAQPEFPRWRTLLDLGGGHGMFALAFVSTHPTLTAVVFDQPAVIGVADEFIRAHGLEQRVATRGGNYLKDDIGQGFDLIWACATLNFARHDLDTLMTKIHEALNPGGIFMAFQDGLTHERTRPEMLLGHLGSALTAGQAFYFDQGEIAASMLRCGFKSVHSRTVPTPMGELDLDIARKA